MALLLPIIVQVLATLLKTVRHGAAMVLEEAGVVALGQEGDAASTNVPGGFAKVIVVVGELTLRGSHRCCRLWRELRRAAPVSANLDHIGPNQAMKALAPFWRLYHRPGGQFAPHGATLDPMGAHEIQKEPQKNIGRTYRIEEKSVEVREQLGRS